MSGVRGAFAARVREAWIWDPGDEALVPQGRPPTPAWKALLPGLGLAACIEPALQLVSEALDVVEADAACAARGSEPALVADALEASPFHSLPSEVLAHVARSVLSEPLDLLEASLGYDAVKVAPIVRTGVPGDPPLRVRHPFAHQRRAVDFCAFVRACRAFRDSVYVEAPELRLEAAARQCACMPPRTGGVPTPFVAQLERQQVSTIELSLLVSALHQVVNRTDDFEPVGCCSYHRAFNACWDASPFASAASLVRRVLGGRVPRLVLAHRGPAKIHRPTPEGVIVMEVTPQDTTALVHLTPEEPEVFSSNIGVRVRGRVAVSRPVLRAAACGDWIALVEVMLEGTADEVQVWRVSTNECVSKLFLPNGCVCAWMRPDPVAAEHVQLHVVTIERESAPQLLNTAPFSAVDSIAVDRWSIAPDGTVRRSRKEPARLKPGVDRDVLYDPSSKWFDRGPVGVHVYGHTVNLNRGVTLAFCQVASGSSGCLAIACTRCVMPMVQRGVPPIMHDERFLHRIVVLDPEDDAFHLVDSMDTIVAQTALNMHEAYTSLSPDGTVLLHFPKEDSFSRSHYPMTIYQRAREARNSRVWYKMGDIRHPAEAILRSLPQSAPKTRTGTWSPCGKYYVRVHGRGVLILDVQETIHNYRNLKCRDVEFAWVRAHPSTSLMNIVWSNGIWLETYTMGILHLGLGASTL